MASGASEAMPVMADQHDGSHDFDFLIGNWKAHVRRLPERLVDSHNRVLLSKAQGKVGRDPPPAQSADQLTTTTNAEEAIRLVPEGIKHFV